MNTINITISKQEIAEDVYRYTANAERERGDDAHIATPDDEDLIFAFIKNGANALNQGVKMYGGAAVDDDNVEISVDMPNNWGADGDALKGAAKSFLGNFVIARWFEMSGTADIFNSACEDEIVRINKLLDKRMKPTR